MSKIALGLHLGYAFFRFDASPAKESSQAAAMHVVVVVEVKQLIIVHDKNSKNEIVNHGDCRRFNLSESNSAFPRLSLF